MSLSFATCDYWSGDGGGGGGDYVVQDISTLHHMLFYDITKYYKIGNDKCYT